jgi:hypothetical protein
MNGSSGSYVLLNKTYPLRDTQRSNKVLILDLLGRVLNTEGLCCGTIKVKIIIFETGPLLKVPVCRMKGNCMEMIDWTLAIKTAVGGFGLVFGILLLLWISIELTRVITEKIFGVEK